MTEQVDKHVAARRKERADYMREYGRRHGAIPVKGTTFVCERCGESVPRVSFRQKWCATCKPFVVAKIPLGTDARCRGCAAQFTKEGHNQAYCQDCRKERGSKRRVGYPWPCSNCSVEIIVQHPRNVYCDKCHELQKRQLLPSIREKSNARNMARRRTDPKFALSRDIGSGMSKSLADGKAGRSWEDLVDYTASELMRHLERQFANGMTWGNRGQWHIDHIIPLSSFRFTSPDDPDFKAAWALTNLRPMWALDNIRKNAKRTLLL